jgi:hypothetical protein
MLGATGARMSFRVISGTDIQEFVDHCATAGAALERVEALLSTRFPNVRVLTADGEACSLADLEQLAEDEAGEM